MNVIYRIRGCSQIKLRISHTVVMCRTAATRVYQIGYIIISLEDIICVEDVSQHRTDDWSCPALFFIFFNTSVFFYYTQYHQSLFFVPFKNEKFIRCTRPSLKSNGEPNESEGRYGTYVFV